MMRYAEAFLYTYYKVMSLGTILSTRKVIMRAFQSPWSMVITGLARDNTDRLFINSNITPSRCSFSSKVILDCASVLEFYMECERPSRQEIWLNIRSHPCDTASEGVHGLVIFSELSF